MTCTFIIKAVRINKNFKLNSHYRKLKLEQKKNICTM